MKIKLIGLIGAGAVLLFTDYSILHAQGPVTASAEVRKDQIKKEGAPAAAGTYQFIVVPSVNGDPFTNDYLIMIENYRDDEKETILPLTQSTKVRIPSRSTINKPDFKPLREIVYTPNNKPTSQRR